VAMRILVVARSTGRVPEQLRRCVGVDEGCPRGWAGAGAVFKAEKAEWRARRDSIPRTAPFTLSETREITGTPVTSGRLCGGPKEPRPQWQARPENMVSGEAKSPKLAWPT
jgi:hypothetical protein